MSIHEAEDQDFDPTPDGIEYVPEEAEEVTEASEELSEDERHEQLKSLAEALIFAAEEPLTEAQFLTVAGRKAKGQLEELVGELNAAYQREGRTFEILRVANGYQFFTRTEYAPALRKLFTERSRTRLSRAALESLAVIAFRGPVTRVEIDEIRGVESGGVLRTLLDRHLIAVKGRADVIGRPLLYETTDEFLKHFGISSLADLPKHHELTREWGELQEAVRQAELEEAEQADLGETPAEEETFPDESVEGEADVNEAGIAKSTNGHNELTAVNLGNKH